MFSLLNLLQGRSGTFYASVILLSLSTSASQLGLFFLINTTISYRKIPVFAGYSGVLFLIMIALSFLCSMFLQRYMIRLGNDMFYDFTMRVFEKLKATSYSQLQELSKEKVYTVVADIENISSFPVQFVTILNALIVTCCGIIYMTTQSVLSGLVLIGLLSAIGLFIFYLDRRSQSRFEKVRELEDDFYRYLEDLLVGFREVTMSRHRKENLHHKFIARNRAHSRDLRVSTSLFILNGELAWTYAWYIVVGIVVFVLSAYLKTGIGGSITILFILYYLMGPANTLIRFAPTLFKLKVSFTHLTDFLATLSRHEEQPLLVNGQSAGYGQSAEFRSLHIEEAVFEYPSGDAGFKVGPLSLRINRGELLFITGGNGSGKSTFIHLLTGLYQPSGGKLYFNEDSIDGCSYGEYCRARMSVIFTDPYLFSHNYENFKFQEVRKTIEQCAIDLRMQHILKVDYDNDIIDRNLSKGQRKRLALIHALLESKPILVMDEWAAEQDPEFRRYFYMEILPALKARGKTLILVTHDDRYFDCADRLLKFEGGSLI